MKNKFEAGQRVGCGQDENGKFSLKLSYGGEYGYGPVFGKVVEVLANGKVKVNWDDSYLNEVVVLYNEKTGKEKNRKSVPATMDAKMLAHEADIKSKFSDLEKEYGTVAKQVRAKLADAGKLIKEAHKIAKKAGFDSLAEMYDATDPLENAMDACGWRSSSWNC
jgi:hypothetical protein